MKLIDILLEKQEPGTYAAVKFDHETTLSLSEYIKDNNIPNGVPESKMHCTVLYSRKHCPKYKPQGKIDPPWNGTPDKLEVWESRGKLRDEDPKRCLVLKFKCEKLNQRHNTLMKEHNATYDFPEYKTHVTLSYDIGDLDETKLPSITEWLGDLVIVEEYGENLDLDWSKTNNLKK